ncbi:MAG TPA: hypothetical protein VLF93_02280 [Candidatus Saccharimonadales bacterium]|nr:hypothetical protein [Candidatus Saccharimonadales bacterium]
MKFLRNKYFLIGALIIIFFAAGAYIQFTKKPWVTIPKNLTSQVGEDQTNTKKVFYNGKYYNIVNQKTFGYEQYSNPQMNISFDYPDPLKYKQITPQLVSLSDPTVKDTDDNTLFIYSTTVPENSIKFKIPFTLPGRLKQTKIIKTQNFTANQEIYSDGTNEVMFLILRQNDQTIVIRIPKDTSYVSQAITTIMSSIKTLN